MWPETDNKILFICGAVLFYFYFNAVLFIKLYSVLSLNKTKTIKNISVKLNSAETKTK